MNFALGEALDKVRWRTHRQPLINAIEAKLVKKRQYRKMDVEDVASWERKRREIKEEVCI